MLQSLEDSRKLNNPHLYFTGRRLHRLCFLPIFALSETDSQPANDLVMSSGDGSEEVDLYGVWQDLNAT